MEPYHTSMAEMNLKSNLNYMQKLGKTFNKGPTLFPFHLFTVTLFNEHSWNEPPVPKHSGLLAPFVYGPF